MGTLIKKNFIFEKEIDFNFISNLLDRNNLISKISSNWIENVILESVFQIKKIENDVFFKELYNQLNNKFNKENKESDLDLFFSFASGNKSTTHRDDYEVFIIGLYGKTLYKIENEEFYVEKGDLLLIKKNELHKAIGLTPRIILSYGIY
jgi:mannose-6-phosphate isomerase-like protein (cupin superfamily)